MGQSENMKSFIAYLKTNEDARQKINDLYEKNKEDLTSEVIALAKEQGFELTPEDVLRHEGELDIEQMHDVSGGRYSPSHIVYD